MAVPQMVLQSGMGRMADDGREGGGMGWGGPERGLHASVLLLFLFLVSPEMLGSEISDSSGASVWYVD